MQTISSTIKILLIDNNQADGVQIERHLAEIKSEFIQLTKIKNNIDNSNLLQSEYFDLIFFIFDNSENNNFLSLVRIATANIYNIPLLLFTDKMSIDLASLPFAVDNCLIFADISPELLRKSIFFALKRAKQNQESNYLKQENSELSSQLVETKNLFQTIIDNTSTLVWMCDAIGNTAFFNQAWSRVLDRENETKLNSNWMVNIHPQDLANCEFKFRQALAESTGFKINYRLKISNQKYCWICNYAVPHFSLEGKFKGLVGYCFDITSLKKTEQKLIRRAASDRLLAQITQKIHASLELEQILQTTVDEVKQFLLAEKIQINRVEETKQLTLLVESRLVDSPLSCDISKPKRVPETLFQKNIACLASGSIVSQNFDESSPDQARACSTLLIPIMGEAKLWGVICVEN